MQQRRQSEILTRRLPSLQKPLLAALAASALGACAAQPGDDNPELFGQAAAALVGKDGTQTIAAVNQVVNTYAALVANAPSGSTSITVSSSPSLGFITPGDLLMIIQMQGATIDTIDASSYGNVISMNGAGLYELVVVSSVAGNTISLDNKCGGLRNSYSVAGHTQVIRVPQYVTLTVPDTLSVSAPAWDGTSGGVVAIYAQTSLDLKTSGRIDVSGLGFRGGLVDSSSRGAGTQVAGYRSIDPLDGAEKGESIAGYQTDYTSGRYGRGAPANGGGGGNANRAGGGGGANGDNRKAWSGQGVMEGTAYGTQAWALDPGDISAGKLTDSSGGGRGGYSSATTNQDAKAIGPGRVEWGGNLRSEVGGLGGHPLRNDPATRLFLGGGGGAGDAATAIGSGSSGGAGGGLVFIMTRDLLGSGTVAADGAIGGGSRGTDDGAGGGGAGGTIVIGASRLLANLTVSANGGGGGAASSSLTNSQGPGGGGGGGFVAVAGGTPTVSANPGAAGLSNSAAVNEFQYNGATYGANGEPSNSSTLPQGTFYPACIPADLKVTAAASQGPVAPGTNTQFTVSVSNQGPNPLSDVLLGEQSPFAANAANWTCTASGGAVCPTATGTGSIGGKVDLPVNGKLTYVISGTVPATMSGGMFQYTLTASPPSGYNDTAPTDNSASASVAVLSGNVIDLGISVVTTPLEPALDEPVTYDFTINNQGPGTTSTPTVTFALPPGGSLVSVLLGDSWNCSTSNLMVTCGRGVPIGPSQTTHLRLIVGPPAGARSLRIIATVSATDGADKNLADNAVTWDVALGGSTIYGTGGGLSCALTGLGHSGGSPLAAMLVALLGAILVAARQKNRSARGGDTSCRPLA